MIKLKNNELYFYFQLGDNKAEDKITFYYIDGSSLLAETRNLSYDNIIITEVSSIEEDAQKAPMLPNLTPKQMVNDIFDTLRKIGGYSNE